MSASRGPAYEEQAELTMLRDQANRSAAAAAQTLTELNRRLERVARPRATARRVAADARVTAVRTFREGPGTLAGQRGAWRAALAALPVMAAAGALLYAAAQGKIKFRHPERVRGFARHARTR